MVAISRRSALAPFCFAALCLAAPGSASAAPTVTVDRACYAPGDEIVETGTGLAPNSTIDETLSLLPFGGNATDALDTLTAPPVAADAQGSFDRVLRAPDLARYGDGKETAHAAFVDQANPQPSPLATAQWTLSVWDVWIRAWAHGTANPRRSMVVQTSGWTYDGPTLYAHYSRGGTVVKDVRIGTLQGPCGDLTRRMRQFPFGHVRPGIWKVYFSGHRVFDKRDDSLVMKVRVR
jgi:hypothetical protein